MRIALRMMEYRSIDQCDLAAELRVHRQTAKYVLDWLHREKHIRIFSWERKSGAPLARYVLGDPKYDAYRPAAYTRAQSCKRARLGLQRNGKSKLRYEAEKRARVARYVRKADRPVP